MSCVSSYIAAASSSRRRQILAAPCKRMKLRAVLDSELVEREMPIGKIQRLAQFAFPKLSALVLSRINKIERKTREMFRGKRNRLPRLIAHMGAAEKFKRIVIQRLHAERKPVDAGGAKSSEFPASAELGLASSVISISCRQSPMPRDIVKNKLNRLRLPSATACRRRRKRSYAPSRQQSRVIIAILSYRPRATHRDRWLPPHAN